MFIARDKKVTVCYEHILTENCHEVERHAFVMVLIQEKGITYAKLSDSLSSTTFATFCCKRFKLELTQRRYN